MLARRFQGQLQLADDEREEDALAGPAVALKRASLFGRAPVLADLTVALTVWGFLGDATPDLIAFRQPLFAEVATRTTTARCARWSTWSPTMRCCARRTTWLRAHQADWRSLLDL